MYFSKCHLTVVILLGFLLHDQAVSAQGVPAYHMQRQTSGFIENTGQIQDQHGRRRQDVKYMFCSEGFKLILRKSGFSYEFYTTEKSAEKGQKPVATKGVRRIPVNFTLHTHRVDISIKGAGKPAKIIAEGRGPEKYHFYTRQTNEIEASSYASVTYQDIYPHIDLIFHTNRGGIKYDIILHPGARLSDIRFAYRGMEDMALRNGKAIIRTSQGQLSEEIPLSYLKESGLKADISYALKGKTLGFKGRYDSKETLVIDPSLSWSTYFGGNAITEGYAVKTDVSGNVLLAGYTSSNSRIASSGAYQTSNAGLYDAFIAKFDHKGNQIWSTYFGGSGNDYGFALATDKLGNIYLGGATGSASGIATTGAQKTSYGGNLDAFIVKFNSSGSRVWGTYYGGAKVDYCFDLALDTAANIYITGYTSSVSGIVTLGAFKTGFSGYADAYLARFSSEGHLKWATYYGDTDDDEGSAVATDKSGAVYLAGHSASQTGIPYRGAYQSTNAGGYDGMLVKFSNTGSVYWGTFFGSTDDDFISSVTVDLNGNVYVGGYTLSTSGLSAGRAYQKSNAGLFDGFISRFSTTGALDWSTFYGGPKDDYINAIVTDGASYLYVTGNTESNSGLATTDGYQTSLADSTDAFLARFNLTGPLRWASYYGGAGNDFGYSIAEDDSLQIYIAGTTNSQSRIASSGAFKTTLSGNSNAFLARFNIPAPDVAISQLILPRTEACLGIPVRPQIAFENRSTIRDSGLVVTLKFIGDTTYTFTDTLRHSIAAGAKDTLTFPLISISKADSYKVFAFIASGLRSNDTSLSIGFNVPPTPNTGFTATQNCNPVVFTNATTISKGSIMNYEWKFDDGTGSTATHPTHHFKKPGNHKVILFATSDKGCTSIFTSTITLDTLQAGLYADNQCAGNPIGFSDSSTGKATSWLWRFGDGSSSIVKNPSHQYAAAGKYTVWLKVTNTNGCSDSTSKSVTVYPLPAAGFSITKVQDNRYYLQASDLTQRHYYWNFGDGKMDSISGPSLTHTYGSNGKYTISLHVASEAGCQASSSDSIAINTSIESEEAAGFDLNVYPDPFSRELTITFQLDKAEKVKISLLDLTGREIVRYSETIQASGRHQIKFSDRLQEIPPGVYMLRLNAGSCWTTQRVIKR